MPSQTCALVSCTGFERRAVSTGVSASVVAAYLAIAFGIAARDANIEYLRRSLIPIEDYVVGIAWCRKEYGGVITCSFTEAHIADAVALVFYREDVNPVVFNTTYLWCIDCDLD